MMNSDYNILDASISTLQNGSAVEPHASASATSIILPILTLDLMLESSEMASQPVVVKGRHRNVRRTMKNMLR